MRNLLIFQRMLRRGHRGSTLEKSALCDHNQHTFHELSNYSTYVVLTYECTAAYDVPWCTPPQRTFRKPSRAQGGGRASSCHHGAAGSYRARAHRRREACARGGGNGGSSGSAKQRRPAKQGCAAREEEQQDEEGESEAVDVRRKLEKYNVMANCIFINNFDPTDLNILGTTKMESMIQ